MLLFLLGLFFLFFSYYRNAPITSGLCFIFRLFFMAPLLSFGGSSFFIYLILLLFLRGIIVLVVYFCSISFVFSSFNINIYIIFFSLFFMYPVFFDSFNIFPVIVYLNLNLLFFIFIIFFLVNLIIFARYITNRTGAIRKFCSLLLWVFYYYL